MTLHDDIHCIQDSIAIPPYILPPNSWLHGACTNDHLYLSETENHVKESLSSSLNSAHTINWEQVQTSTSSDDNMLLLLSTMEESIPENKHLHPTGYTIHSEDICTALMVPKYIQGQNCYPTLLMTIMPIHPTCNSLRYINHDLKNIHLLAWHHK